MERIHSKIRPHLIRIARKTYRSPGESPVSGGHDLLYKYALGLGLLATLLVIYGPLAVQHVHDWETFKIDVPVSPTAWRVDLAASEDCEDKADAVCLADPANPRLWTSNVERGDPFVALRSPSLASRRYAGSHFWLGTVIEPAVLQKAAQARANHFALGWLNAPYRIWMDGQIMQEGDGTSAADPIVLMVPMSRLSDPKPLHIAVRLAVVAGEPILDAFNEDRTGRDLGVDGHGFMTQKGSVTYHNLIGFWGKARPFALALGYLLISALMFFFWLPLKNKPEYYYMALFAVSGAVFQCERFDLFNFGRSAVTNSNIELLSLFWMPSLGLITGLAFARIKIRLLNRLMLALVLVPIAVIAFVPAGALHELFKLLTIVVYIPVVPLIAGGVCLTHAYHLAEQSKSSLSAPVRIRRLTWFGLMEIANGLLFLALFHNIGSEPKRLYWVGFEQMMFFMSFCAIVLSEYSLQEYLVKNTPVSEYHQRPILPEMVSGAILSIDIKNSEALFRAGASIGEGAQFVDKCLAAMWSAAVKSGGVVLQTEGDSIRVLFDQAAMRFPVVNALEAVNGIARRLAEVDAALRAEGYVSADAPAVGFRGGLSFGKVKPVWHTDGKSRQAAWTEVGDTNAFVESSRYMELERSVKGPEYACGLVVMPESLVSAVPADKTQLLAGIVEHHLSLVGKHARNYDCAVYMAQSGREGEKQTHRAS